jgi:hypothetical protein
MPGYIKLFRDLKEHELWKIKRKFSKAEAWIDIIFRCNHKCERILHGYQKLLVKRGQFISSNYELGNEWGWSESSARKFIEYCVESGMMKIFPTKKYTLYEVSNYCVYQGVDTEGFEQVTERTENAQKTHKKRTARAQKTPNNNDNNDNNEKKDIYITAQHLSMSKEEYDKLVSEYGKEKVDDKIDHARNYAKLKNYKSLYLTLDNWLKKDKPPDILPGQVILE